MATRAFSYLLQPTVRQSHALDDLLRAQRELYNAALEHRRGAWRWERRGVTRFEQFSDLKFLHVVRPDVMRFGVCCARGTLTRLDRAFLTRVRAGGAPGFPRFRGPGRFDSVEYPDRSGWKLDEEAKRLYLLGVGHVKVRLHRPLRGVAKTCTLKREGRRWRVTVFCTGVPAQPLAPTGQVIGIDLGVGEANLVATSAGELIGGPGRGGHSRRGSPGPNASWPGVGGGQRAQGLGAPGEPAPRQRLRRDRPRGPGRRQHGPPAHGAPRPRRAGRFSSQRGRRQGGAESFHPRRRVGPAVVLHRVQSGRRWSRGDRSEPGPHLPTLLRLRARGAGEPARAVFRCRSCAHEAHADVNAAINVLGAGLALRLEREAGNAA